jgi:hypothetical protein
MVQERKVCPDTLDSAGLVRHNQSIAGTLEKTEAKK